MIAKQVLVLVPLALVATLAACSSAETRALGASNGGATLPADEAIGVCCPAATGGCAKMGGYHTDGSCKYNEICDNMCEQKVVADEHGCQKLTWKKPPVTTTIASTASCSSPEFNGVPYGGSRDAGADSEPAATGADASTDAR